ncbi:MAG: TerD family protein [Deltaproteobacteria bacterium]|jgi:tellurium resistance protein TerD|nr:TerD family protein [Deltaproteobacteria bacterium]
MAISLVKGGNISLDAAVADLKSIFIGLGWDERGSTGQDFDLDASAFLLRADGKVRGDQDLIFYNNLRSADGSIEHTGDNLVGTGEGDDDDAEVIKVDLVSVPQEIQRIAVTVTIHEADARRQNFGQVSNAYIRVVNQADNAEIVRFDLSEDMSTETAMIFGEVYRRSGQWKFKAVGQGFAGGLAALCANFGIEVL